MKSHVFRVSNLLMAAVLIAVMIALVACRPTSSTTPTPTAAQTTTNPSATATRPFSTFTRPPSSSPASTATPSSPVPSSSPASSSSPLPSPASSPLPSRTATPSTPASPTPASTSGSIPLISITSPYYLANVPSGDVTINIVVTNFNLVDKTGQANAPGEGHIVYYLDVAAPTTSGQPALTDSGTYVETNKTSYTWKNVAPGMHLLSAQLVNNDGTPLNPPIVAKEYVLVQGGTPSPSITASPSPTATR